MKPNTKLSYLTHLSTLCDQPYSLPVKIALLSLQKTPALPFLEPILLVFEYFQILSAFLFFGLEILNTPQTMLYDILNYLSRLINPAYWISFDQIHVFEMTIMGIVTAFTIFKYLLLGYITFLASEKAKPSDVLQKIWRFIFKTQSRIIYHILISFWIAIINSLQENKDTENNAKYVGFFLLSCLMILLETILTLHLNLYFCYILPTKSLLSQKDNTIDITNVFHKLILQLLTVIFALNSTKLGLWIFAICNLLADLLRYFHFFTILPFYSFKALTYQLTLMMLITSFNVSYFVICIVQYTNYETSQHLSLLILLWIILSILALKLSHGILQRLFWRVLADPKVKSPYLLVHRVQATRQLRKSVRPHFEYNDNYSWTLLVNKTLNQHLKTIMAVSSGEDLNNKASAKLIFKQYFEGLAPKYPNDKFIKLYLMQFYIKSLKEIQEPIRIGTSLYKSADRRIKFNLQMLAFDMESNIQTRYLQLGKEKDTLNLSQFIKEQALYAQIKQKIIRQASLQVKICDELRKDHSDIAVIFNDAQILSKHRKKTLALINNSLTKFSEYNIEPLLLFSHYHLTLNHSVKDSHDFSHIYSKRYAKYQRFYSQENLAKENMFQSHAGFYLLKASEFDAGTIVIGSKSVSRMLERDPENPSNLNAFHSAPPCLRPFYSEVYKDIGKKGEKVLLNQITPGFLYNEMGYLIQTQYYMNVHPFLANGLFFTLLMRPTLSKSDYMYILENGSIDSTTKNIGQLLKIPPNSTKETSPGTNFHLRNISKELAVVNQAFNIIFHSGQEFFPEAPISSMENASHQVLSINSRQTSKQSMSLEQARQIYSVYSTTGKDIFLVPTRQTKHDSAENIGYLYNCRVVNLQLGSVFVKLFTLVRKGKAQKVQGDHSFGTFYTEDIEDIGIVKHEETIDPEENLDEFPTTLKPTLHNHPDVTTTTTRLHADTSRNFLLTSRDVPSPNPMLTFQAEELPTKKEDHTDSPSLQKGVENLETQNARIVKPLEQSRTGTYLSSSHENRMADLYLASLDVKYAPKILKRLEIFFYLVMLNTLILQIPLKIVSDNNLESIRTNNDILRSAQLRNQKLIVIHTMTGIIWDLHAGILNSTDFGPLSPYVFVIPSILDQTIQALAESNQVLLENTDSLTTELQNAFFTNDVRIFDTYIDGSFDYYQEMNNFQAVDRIIQVSLKLIQSNNLTDIPDAEGHVDFLFRNCLNELLLKDQQISEIFLDILAVQRKEIKHTINIYLLILLLALGALLVPFLIILYRQYVKQTCQLSAVCRINPIKLELLSRGFAKFKQVVESDLIKFDDEAHNLRKKVSQTIKDSTKRGYTKTIEIYQMQKIHLIRFGKLLIMMAIIFTCVVVRSFLSTGFIQDSQSLQGQIYSSDFVQTRHILTLATYYSLTDPDNSAQIETHDAYDELQSLVQEIAEQRANIYSSLPSIEKNELIQELMYGDPCEAGVFGEAYAIQCNYLNQNGIRSGLIYLSQTTQSLSNDLLDKYARSGKTAEELKVLEKENFALMLVLYFMISLAGMEVTTIIDDNFTKEVDKAFVERSGLLAVYFGIIVIVAFLIKKCVINKLNREVCQFKNILRVLPLDLAVSSFILKSFLLKTAGGVLDPVKSDL